MGDCARTYRGACHCGKIAFECVGELESVSVCNCSMCAQLGFMHWIVPRDCFRLLTPLRHVSTYDFANGRLRHCFCSTCGNTPFSMPRAHPGSVDVNLRCLDGVELGAVPIDYADSRLREAAHKRAGHRGFDA